MVATGHGGWLWGERLLQHVTIHKLSGQSEHVVAYAGEVAEWLENGVRVIARWERPELDLGYARFETGDVFIEWFFTDRWYNIFEVRAGASLSLKGWYCNVATPAQVCADHVDCRDLLLDVWVAPSGEALVLDDSEFAAAEWLDDATRAAAERGLAELLGVIGGRLPPFDKIESRLTGAH